MQASLMLQYAKQNGKALKYDNSYVHEYGMSLLSSNDVIVYTIFSDNEYKRHFTHASD